MSADVIDRPDAPSAEGEMAAGESSQALAGLPALIGAALLALILYAAFDHGAVGLAPGARIELALAAVGAVAVAAWLGVNALRFKASRLALSGVALLGGFACWCGMTVLWSVAPDQTWVELNRAIAYVIVVGVSIGLGATHPRAPALLLRGFLAVAALVSLYALGQKLVPGLHLAGLFDLNQTGAIPRLQEPIGYWNALALFVVLGVPLALHLAVDPARAPGRRLAAAGGLELLLLTVALTLSRGGLVALGVALIVAVGGSRERLRTLAWIALPALAAVAPIVVGLSAHSLTSAGAGLPARETSGAILAGVLIASLAGLYLGGRVLLAYEPRLRLAPGARRAIRRAGLAGVALLIAGGLVAAILTHAWHGFTSPTAPSNVNPNRLLSTDSFRWLWWKEAASAFAARPLGGWGAGSFGVLHLIYRHNTLPVQQPHSVPLQFLSETGLVGALLGLGGLALLLAAAVRSARIRDLKATERGVSMALLAGAAAYVVHSLYDWDWNIPAVTLPALMFIGVLAGAERRINRTPATQGDGLRAPASLGTRILALTTAILWLGCFALSALLPSLAANRASAALIEASSPSPAALVDAQAKARLASALDPLSDAGLRAEASIALHRRQLARARYDLQEAVGREPSDELAWNELAAADAFLRDPGGARQAARRVIALDPQGRAARGLANLAGFGR